MPKVTRITKTRTVTTKKSTKTVPAQPKQLTSVRSSILEHEFVMKIFVTLPLFAAGLSILFKADYMGSIGLFLGLPAILLSLLLPFSIKKSALFSFLVLPIGFVVVYIAHILGQWVVTDSLFPRILGVVPVENLLWIFLMTYTTIMFYEYFLDRQNDRAIYNKKFVNVYALFIAGPLVYFILGFAIPQLFNIQYFLLICGVVTVLIPIILFLMKYPGFRSKFIVTGTYFFYLGIIYELTAIARYWWYYPIESKYFGVITLFGMAFPLEQLVFVLMLFSVAIIAWYEFFDDDRM